MKRTIYIIFPVLALVSMLLSGFGLAPLSAKQAVNATPMPTLISGLGTPVQTPQSAIFGSCPSVGEGKVVTDFAKDLKGVARKDYADYMSPESLARYVATHKDYLKTLTSEESVKYAAGLSSQDRESYLKTLTSTERKEFEADLAEYQQGELYQNELKNRYDSPSNYESDYKSMKFQDLLNLPPTAADIRRQLALDSHWKNRGTWEVWQKELIYRYEGLAIKVDGYIFYLPASKDPITNKKTSEIIGAQEMNAESTNCFFTTDRMVDWHITLTETSEEPNRSNAVVVEATPRIRDSYSKEPSTWTIKKLTVIAKHQYRVRISGWLFFDPEHPANLPDFHGYLGTRGALWEIHPVMRIFVKLVDNDSSPWYPLENCSIDTHHTTGKTDDTLTCTKPDSSEAP